jgi:hypothetical protein
VRINTVKLFRVNQVFFSSAVNTFSRINVLTIFTVGLAALAKAQQEVEEEKKKFQKLEKEKNSLLVLQDEKTKQMETTLQKRHEEQEQAHKSHIELLGTSSFQNKTCLLIDLQRNKGRKRKNA